MKNKLAVFECHGVAFEYTQGEQEIGTCPFCSKKNHFYINRNTGQWDCKKCGKSGNIYSFLKQYSDAVYSSTTTTQYKSLAQVRSLPIRALRNWKLGWDGAQWLMPVLSASKVCRDIRRWTPKTSLVKSTTGCKSQLYGWYLASKTKIIWLCEGEWDAIAMGWLLEMTGKVKERAVGVPGAMTFKDEWIDGFIGKTVYICYDKDSAGEQGILKAYSKIGEVAKSIKIIKWPIELPGKFDVRDFIKAGVGDNKPLKLIHKELRSFLTDPSQITILADEENELIEEEEILDDPPTFNETLRIYSQWCRMTTDLIHALKIMFAVVLSTKESGEPLWIHIVGPAGCGKTMLLMSLDGSKRCEFVDNVSPHALVSGYQSSHDPSLLPKLNRRCCVWKDFTEILEKPAFEKDGMYATLRSAYDGRYFQKFGNNVVRSYPDLRFSMVTGVTPAIYGDRKASLGERFLKFEIYRDKRINVEQQVRAAIENMSFEDEAKKALQNAARDFLSRNVEILPAIPAKMVDQTIALANLISYLRQSAEREVYGEKVIRYKPVREVSTRLTKQLLKLGQFLAVVAGRDCITYKEYRLMKKVGFATSIKTHIEILQIIMRNNGLATTGFIAEKVLLSRSSVERQLHDMQLLDVVNRNKSPQRKIGRTTIEWSLQKEILSLCQRAEVSIS